MLLPRCLLFWCRRSLMLLQGAGRAADDVLKSLDGSADGRYSSPAGHRALAWVAPVDWCEGSDHESLSLSRWPRIQHPAQFHNRIFSHPIEINQLSTIVTCQCQGARVHRRGC